jgi:hypothetical protein
MTLKREKKKRVGMRQRQIDEDSKFLVGWLIRRPIIDA